MRPGQIIAGKYRLLRVVRSGGVSIVYRGESLKDRQPVAIKLINVAQAAADLRLRIDREVEILRRLDHPHIVHCFDHGVIEDDHMFLALEWLEGDDLSDYKAQHSLTLRQVLQLLVQLSDALQASHELGVVHRDIKPANIYLMNPQPGLPLDVRLIDFGVAKLPETSASLTRAGAILGTPAYMSPEQASQATDADGRADIFSLGVVAYELVCGKLPWTSTTDLARLARILVEQPVPLDEVVPDVPEAVSNLVMGMLDNDLARRIPSAQVVTEISYSCLDVLSPHELDSTYVRDERLLGAFVRAETLDLPKAARRPAPPPRVPLPKDSGLDAPAPPSVRYRSVVRAVSTLTADDLDAVPEVEEHHETQELLVPERPSTLDHPPPEEPTEFRSAPQMSATEALDAVSNSELPAVPLAALNDPSFAGLLSYVDHSPSSMLYGRVAGLERLERRVTQSLGVAQSALTLVIGPAGIGKTRVRTELAKVVRAGRHPPRVFSGRAEESFRTTPYAFLRRVLLTEARVASDDDDEVRRAKILRVVPAADAVRRILGALEAADGVDAVRGPSADLATTFMSPALLEQMGDGEEAEEDRAVIAAFLCEALGVAYPDIPPVVAARHDPRLLGQQLRRALDVVLRALAEEAGMVILVDDAHLLDGHSAEILHGLTDPKHRVPIAVVAFALPTILDPDTRERSSLIADSGGRETVQLGPLEPRASREMARSLVNGPVQADALEQLVQRASGNPLYLEQLVRAVQATGALTVGPDGEFVLSPEAEGSADTELVPPTVAASVSARLSLLKPQLQRTITAAAVFGEVFWAEGVACLVQQPVEDVVEDLDRLLLANLVRRRSVSRYKGETELEFTHAVVRSVALSRLKRQRRKAFEVAAADYLASVGEDDQAVLARHVAQGGLHERAAALYAAAGAKALALGDVTSAGILAEDGLRVAEGGAPVATRIELLGILEQVALGRADWELGRETMDALSELPMEPMQAAQLLLRRSRLASIARRYEEARVEAQEAERAFAGLEASMEQARSQLYVAEASEALGDGRGALRSYLSAHLGLSREGASADLARTSRGLARIAVSSGDYPNAENRFRSALVSSRAVRDYPGIFLADLGLAEVWHAMGNSGEASAFLEEAQRTAFDRAQKLMVRAMQIALLFEEERFDDAYASFDRLYGAAEGGRKASVRRRAALGMGQSFRRRPAQDARLAERRDALETTSTRLRLALEQALTDDPALITALQLAAAVVEALRGASDRALGLAEDAQARFQSEGALSGDEPPAVFYAVARVHQITGSPDAEVRHWMDKALSQLDSICGRLQRKARVRYLDRPQSRALLEEAERLGISVSRDVHSNRVLSRARDG